MMSQLSDGEASRPICAAKKRRVLTPSSKVNIQAGKRLEGLGYSSPLLEFWSGTSKY